jgi:hypothetical protein
LIAVVAKLVVGQKGVSAAALALAGARAGEEVAAVGGKRRPFCARHLLRRR